MAKWIAAFCMAGILAAQSKPVFQTGTRLVQLDVTVHSDKGPSVKGLTKDDFTVTDKGKTQTIAVFAVTGPAGEAPSGALPPGVMSNRMNSKGEMAQSATVVLFDRLNTQDAADQANGRRNILQLLSTLKPTDKVAFYSLYDNVIAVSEFMDSAESLATAAKNLSASSPPTGLAPADQAMLTLLRDALQPTQPLDKPTRVNITLKAFQSIARRLQGVPGRKNLLWVTSNVPLTYGQGTERRENDLAEVNNYARALSEGNVTLYTVDPRGAGSSSSAASAATRADGTRTSGTDSTRDNTGGGALIGGPTNSAIQTASALMGIQGMQTMAQETGGKAFINVNNIADPLREVFQYVDPTYTLGFYVDDKNLDGKTHDLKVTLSKNASANGAKAFYRQHYVAESLSAPAAQRTSMADLSVERLDSTAIGLMAVAQPDPSKPGIDVVQVRVDMKDMQWERRVDKWVASFDLGMSIELPNARPVAPVVLSKTVSFTDDQLKQVLAAGADIDNTVPAPAQNARLRIVVQDKVSGLAGSVRIPLMPNPGANPAANQAK